MDDLTKPLIGALRCLVHPVILVIVGVPMLVALAIWLGLGWLYWDSWTAAIQGVIVDHANWTWAANWDVARLASWIAVVIVVALWLPLVLLTALVLATLFAMPMLVRHVASSDFPGLEKRRGGSVLGSFWNAFAAIGAFAVLWIVTLPLWLLGPLAALLPLLLSAWLNQRLFRYDALSEHADAGEIRQVIERSRGRLYLLGLITGLLYFLPPLNLVAPIYSALVFIYFCLGELQRLRAGDKVVSG